MLKILLAGAAVSLSAGFCHAEKFIPATESHIRYMGRSLTTAEGHKAFNFPGFTAMLNFTGPSLSMATSPGSGYFVVEIDSLPPRKVHYDSCDSLLTLADNLAPGPHSARITYAIEGYQFQPRLKGFGIADTATALPATEKNRLKIEFIGNSMTCGYGTDAASEKDHFSYATENHCRSFAHLTGRALDADVNIVARSGIGVYRNYDGPREGSPTGTMAQEYDKTMIYDDSAPWDFTTFQPDIICINLGTNDLSTGNYDIALYEKAYSGFLDHVRAMNPKAKIVLLTGSMLTGRELAKVKAVLDRIARGRKEVYRFDFSPITGKYGYGADWHPSAARSRVMADELVRFLSAFSAPTH